MIRIRKEVVKARNRRDPNYCSFLRIILLKIETEPFYYFN
jgi:hypothetical protein